MQHAQERDTTQNNPHDHTEHTATVTVNNSTSAQPTTSQQPNDHNIQAISVLQPRTGNSAGTMDNGSSIVPEIVTKQQA